MYAVIEFKSGDTEYYGPAGLREVEDWLSKRLDYWSYHICPVRGAYMVTNQQARYWRNPAGARIITGPAYPVTPMKIGHTSPYE